MANRFLNNIKINDSYTLPDADGTEDQIIKTNGAGELTFIDQGDVIAGEADKAKSVVLRVKNSTASAMTKGQVICEAVSASPPSGNLIEVALADNNGTNTMPALGILNEDLDAAGGANDEGDAIMFGKVSGIDTSAFSVGDEVFVSDTPGGLTITKPTGVKYIQKVGVVIRDDNTNGTIEVFGAGRVNDVPTPLYVDHANQRLGIGTTSPSYVLDVVGEGNFSSYVNVNSATGIRTSSGWIHLSRYGDTNQNVAIGNNGTDVDLYVPNGRVGIGTTSPSDKLHIVGSNGSVRIDNSSSTKSFSFTVMDSNNRFRIYDNTAGSERLTITNGGNVGIGTTSPTNKLDVIGTLSATNIRVGSTASGEGIIRYNGGSGNGIGIVTGALNSSAIGLFVDHSANNRNVGIGTTSPSEKLEVVGNAILDASNANLKIKAGITGTKGDIQWTFNTDSTVYASAGIAYDNRTTDGFLIDSGYPITLDYASGYIRFLNNGSEKMRINTSGNVGIGTTSPSAKLSVNGTTQLAGEVSLPSTGTATASVNYPSQTLRFTTSAWDTNNSVARDVHWNIRNEGSSTIYPDGTLAFYEESPSYNHWKLKLPGRGSGSTYIHPDAALFNGRVNIYESDTSNINISLHPGGDSYFNGGNVGIGTASPGEKLEVDGYAKVTALGINSSPDAYLSSLNARLAVGGNIVINTNLPQLYLRANSTSNTSDIRYQNSLKLTNGSGSTHLTVTSGGNVGIGTTSPGAKLDVEAGGTGDAQGDSTTAAIFRAGRQNVWFQNQRTAAGTDWNNNTFKIIAQIDSTSHQSINFVNDASYNEHIDIYTGNQVFNTRFNANGSVGIGTTSPNNLGFLEKVLNISAGSSSSTTLQQAGIVISGSSDADDADDFGYLSFTNYQSAITNDRVAEIRALKNGTNVDTGEFAFYTSSGSGPAERMRITSSGNVGIGTTSPSGLLDVSNGVNSIFIESGGSYPELNADVVLRITQRTEIWGGGAGRHYLDVRDPNGNQNIKLNGEGNSFFSNNLGIGTTSPSQKLHVVGNARVTGAYYDSNNLPGTSGQVLSSTATGTDWVSLSEISGVDGTGTANTVAMWSDSDTITDAPITVSGNNATFAGSIYSGSTIGNLTSGSLGQRLELGNSSITTLRFDADAWRVYAGGSGSSGEALRVTETGNVGIGTTSPNATLKVQGPSDTATISTSSTPAARINNGGAISLWIGSNHYNYGYVQSIQDDGSNIFKRLSLQPLGGDVGIGTTSPSQKLDVNGNIISTSGSGNFIRSKHSASAYAQLESNSSGGIVKGIGGNGFLIRSYGDSFFNGGNVGIGITSPSQKLEVSGNIKITETAATTDTDKFVVLDSGVLKYRTGAQVISDLPTDSRYVAVTGDTMTGGLTMSNAQIQITDSGAQARMSINNTGTGDPQINFQLSASSKFTIGVDNSDSDKFKISGSSALGSNDRIVVDSSGNVGIGTTSPTAKLDVAGAIKGGGKVTYTKSYGSLDTTGQAVAGLTAGNNGNSAGFIFTCFGGDGYQKIVYSCKNAAGTWDCDKDIDEGTNSFDVVASANSTTITFTFKARSATQWYSPRVTVEAFGVSINTTYF